ncbi:hypothetical protein [Anaerovorax sp. IOR16]|nr:hypothetical protein [Anaerovorax sp. IOR16]
MSERRAKQIRKLERRIDRLEKIIAEREANWLSRMYRSTIKAIWKIL